MPDPFVWKCPAKREKKRGRAKGGMITRNRKGVRECEKEDDAEGIQERRIIINKEEWRLLTVYSRDIKETIKELQRRTCNP